MTPAQRKKLEKKAEELNLPFEETTTDEELQALVEANSAQDNDADEKTSVVLVSAGKVVGGPEKGYQREFSLAQHGPEWKEAAKAWKERYC